jgi:cell division inhibitor SulA
MRRYIVRLDISAAQMLRYYRGTATSVRVVAEGGSLVQFPVTVLRPFVTEMGVQGRFLLWVAPGGQLRQIRTLASV